MRASGSKSKWSHYILAIALAAVSSPVIANPTTASSPTIDPVEPTVGGAPVRPLADPEQARAFLAEWLLAQGYQCPNFEVSEAGVPHGADAATFCRAKACVIRIRPGSLRATIANTRMEGTSRRQWQNLLLHEAVHYIDIQQRGTSDHGHEFRKLAREFGVVYKP